MNENMDSVTTRKRAFSFPLVLLFLYVLVEYGKPRFLDPFRPAVILQIALLVFFVINLGELQTIIKERYFKLYFILLGEMAVHVFIAVNNFLAFVQWRLMISYLIFNLSFVLFLEDTKKLRIFISVFISVHVMCAINRIFSTGVIGYTGFMGDKNDFALAMNVVLPLSFYMGLSYLGVKRILFLLSAVIFIIANVVTQSRGGFVGLAAVAVLCWFSSKNRVRNLIVMGLLAFSFWSLAPEEYKAEIISIEEEGAETGTGRDRIELWKVAWRAFTDNPAIGVGQGNLGIRFPDYQYDRSGTSFWGRAMWGRAVHSVYFTALAELGLVGFLIWGLMIKNSFNIYNSIKKETLEINNRERKNKTDMMFMKNIIKSMLIGIIGYLVGGIFLSAFYYPHFWNISSLITATYLIYSRKRI